MNTPRLISVSALGCLMALFTGCATIVKDDSQPVAFSSDPQGATVSINGTPRGQTPTTIMVKRAAKKQMIQMELAGYETEIFPLGKSVAGMTFGNIIFGGVIGVGVDIATGKATNYEESVHVKMRAKPGTNIAEASAALSMPSDSSIKTNATQQGSENVPYTNLAPGVRAPEKVPASVEERLSALERLKDGGHISEEEYQARRKAILDGI